MSPYFTAHKTGDGYDCPVLVDVGSLAFFRLEYQTQALMAVRPHSSQLILLLTESGSTKDAIPKQSDAISERWDHGILNCEPRARFQALSSVSSEG